MRSKKTQEIAFQKLLKISRDQVFGLYETCGDDMYGYRSWPVEWDKELRSNYKTPEDKQKALNETLMRLTRGDFPEKREQMEQERKVIQLTLLAGANPNSYDFYLGSAFDSFWYSKKGYGLLELGNDDRFESPKKLQEFYESFCWKSVYYDSPDEEILLAKQENENRAALIYRLFQKGMLPTNPKVFKELAPVVLEKEPEFFNKRKEQVVSQMKHAKTPIQIYNAIMGRRKEKN